MSNENDNKDEKKPDHTNFLFSDANINERGLKFISNMQKIIEGLRTVQRHFRLIVGFLFILIGLVLTIIIMIPRDPVILQYTSLDDTHYTTAIKSGVHTLWSRKVSFEGMSEDMLDKDYRDALNYLDKYINKKGSK